MKTKKCADCGKRKNISLFHFINKLHKYRQRICNSCHYQRRKEYFTKRQRDRRILARQFINSVKEGFPCADCGKYYPHYVMEFDHVKEKCITISALLMKSGTISTILEEAAKCEIVCANCHNVRTHKRRMENKI